MEKNGLIYNKISSIMQECPAIAKTKKNTQQGYSYRGIDDAMNTLQNLLPKYGVFYVPEVIESMREERQTKSGGSLIYSVLKVKYTFYAEDGSHVSAIVQSEGMDSADKSSNKAMSAACKYALFQVFNIPTVDFVDPDASTPESSHAVSKQTPKSNYPGDEEFLKNFCLPKNFSTDMTVEDAEAVRASNGITYGEMKLEDLYKSLDAMLKRLERNHLNSAQREELQNRVTAIYLLFDKEKKQKGF
jgi:hypothetical protein